MFFDGFPKFLDKSKFCHIFVDEFPIPQELSEKDEHLIEKIAERAFDLHRFFWITFRLVENDEKEFFMYQKSVEKHRDSLSKAGFVFPKLDMNMRNSSNIQSSYDNIFQFGQFKKSRDKKTFLTKSKKELFKSVVSKASLPSNTIPGKVTKVIPICDYSKEYLVMLLYE